MNNDQLRKRLAPNDNGYSRCLVCSGFWHTGSDPYHKADCPVPTLVTEVMCGSLGQEHARAVRSRANDGCGKPIPIADAYRCTDCTRWYHRRCLASVHFNRALVEW